MAGGRFTSPSIGSSAPARLSWSDKLKESLPDMKSRISTPGIDLKVVMDQSVYVRASVAALVQEGTIGAILCSLVILLFLGQWRMTIIAIVTLPLSVLVGIVCLNYTGQTINVMTLAGLTLAIGPMIDSAIICLENTHRHLAMGATPANAAVDGASEVAMPELVSTLCTFLVLSPLALMPGMGRFLFLPMTLAVMFAMTSAYLLSRTFVPCASAFLLSHHHHSDHLPHGEAASGGHHRPAFARLQKLIDRGIDLYVKALDVVLRHKAITIAGSFTLLAITLVLLLPVMRRDFFPEVDSGAFEIAARAPAGTRIEETEKLIEQVENYIKETIPEEDLDLIVSELGLTANWSAAYTVNAGTMDAIMKIQLKEDRSKTSQEYIRILREGLTEGSAFQSPGVFLRFRRPGARRLERGGLVADQHPDPGQETGRALRHRRQDQEGGPGHSRRCRCPRHSKAERSRVDAHRRSGQVGRTGADAGRRHEERHRRDQFERHL